METNPQKTQAIDPNAPAREPESLLAEIEGRLHHLELLPTATSQWFREKFAELKEALTGEKDATAEPLLADAGASTANIRAEALDEEGKPTTADLDNGDLGDGDLNSPANAELVQAQTIGTITDGVNEGLKDAYPGSTSVTTDDDSYTVVYTRSSDNLKADAQPLLNRAEVSGVNEFVTAAINSIKDWYVGYDNDVKAKAEAQI